MSTPSRMRDGKLIAPFRKVAAPPSPRACYLMRSPESLGKAEVDAFVAWLLAEVKADTARPKAQSRAARRP